MKPSEGLNDELQRKSSTSTKQRRKSSTNVEDKSVHANPYALAPTFTMELRGKWATGGVIEFFAEEQRLDFIKLPPAPWAIMARLVLAAIHSQSSHWFDAFVETQHLTELLKDHDLASFPTGQTVYRIVNKIRSKLAASSARKLTGSSQLTGKQWAELVLENEDRKGYRIGLPPSQLRLVIGDLTYEAKSDQRNDPEDKKEANRSP